MNPIRKKEFLTAKEICEMFNCSESGLLTNFKRTATSIKKKFNVDLIRCERADGEKYYQIFEDTRALTIYNEIDDIPITLESLKFEAYEFYVFLGVAASPFGAYRGKREDLLKYIGFKNTKKNIEILNQVIKSLVDKKCLLFYEDEEYIILSIKGQVEEKYSIRVEMLRECQRIADENHKSINKIPQLLQVWEAVRICAENQPFTYAELSQITGLSYKQIRDVKKLLEQNDAFITSREGSYFQCVGMNVDLNGFFDEQK